MPYGKKFKKVYMGFICLGLCMTCLFLPGCGKHAEESAVQHQEGEAETPYSTEKYEENGYTYCREQYLGFEAVYPIMDKAAASKEFINMYHTDTQSRGDFRPRDAYDSYQGEPYNLQRYYRKWPIIIEDENIREITYTVFNTPGMFTKEIAKSGEDDMKVTSSLTVRGDEQQTVYLCLLSEFYGIKTAFTGSDASEFYVKKLESIVVSVQVTYENNEKKIYYYGIEGYNEYNDSYLKFYQLTFE